jgi:uncharacterized repeat protein (TIGR04138 family)
LNLQRIEMQEANFETKLEQIRAKDPRYERDAYAFVREALDYTQQSIKKKRGRIRHITGQELLSGMREMALEKFGPMAFMMLEEWGVHSCRDFGAIVFNMVDVELLAKTDKDSRADFENGYDFYDAFRRPFLPPSRQGSREPLPSAKK